MLLLLINYNIGAQTLKVISGKIINSKDNLPIPFVHIQIKGWGVGTISNQSGYFSLKIPSTHHEKKLVVSYIGYEPFELEINSINKPLQIKLRPIDYQIGEVIIMPDSTLLTLLEKAFKKIPENYPDYPTSLTGFYRESVKTSNNDYAYFAEAVTQTYKNSYKKQNSIAQVKIIKSLTNEFPALDSLKIRFYGGVFEPGTGDIILRRGSFINPKNFKNYNYTLEGITKFNDNE
ncbi:MAG: carboxypeptidase-like regulatory domain-containing protein, partial [Bacteroidales bacterium]|nr:carboxypeptidase-like regulatory domain-containing protein [Bacteroidales bacterium]